VARMVLLEEWPLVEVATALGIGAKRVERHMAKVRARLRQVSALGRGDCGGGEKGGIHPLMDRRPWMQGRPATELCGLRRDPQVQVLPMCASDRGICYAKRGSGYLVR
jgi:hypothetical protein